MSETRKVIIIGSGPAGHTAAIYAGRALLQPLMFEGFLAGGIAAGGQLTTTTDVENFPGFPQGISGPALMDQMRAQSLHAGCEILTQTVDHVDLSQRPFKVISGDATWFAESIIIATGAVAKRMGLPGEEQYRQRGVSACAVCDGALPLFRNQPLVVIGGGDSAIEEATYLTKYASHVTLLVRREVLRASQVMQQRAFDNPKLTILWQTEATEITGDGKVMTGITVRHNQTGETSSLAAAGLFYAIGHQPNTPFLAGQLALDEQGYIVTSGHMSTQTSVAGVFAAGDVQDKQYRQAITSAGTGCMAALEAEHFLTLHT